MVIYRRHEYGTYFETYLDSIRVKAGSRRVAAISESCAPLPSLENTVGESFHDSAVSGCILCNTTVLIGMDFLFRTISCDERRYLATEFTDSRRIATIYSI